MRVKLGELAEWAGGRLTTDDVNHEIIGVSIDSRTIRPGEAYVALRGQNHDGHDFVAEAMDKGAAVAVVEDESRLVGTGIVVGDSLSALGQMAHRYRWSHPLIPWVAVTGSNGKTTTREMIVRILSTRGPVVYPKANYNNLVGMPLTILERPEDAWIGVLEMGTSAPGEIARLAEIAMPTVALVTGTAAAHLEGLGNLDSVAHEKGAVFDRLPHDGVAIYPAGDQRAAILAGHICGPRATFAIDSGADMVAENIRVDETGSRFVVRGVEFFLPLLGRHNVSNCLAALLAAEHFGVGLQEAAQALASMEAVPHRLQVAQIGGMLVLDDAYNANPVSLAAAVETLFDFPDRRHVAIVGDMAELGSRSRALHREAGRQLGRRGLDVILVVGRRSVALAEGAETTNARSTVRHFSTVKALLRDLDKYLEPGDVVLVKGSRSMKLETVVNALRKKSGD